MPGLCLIYPPLTLGQLVTEIGDLLLQLIEHALVFIPLLFDMLQRLSIAINSRFQHHGRLRHLFLFPANIAYFLLPREHTRVLIFFTQLQHPVSPCPVPIWTHQAFTCFEHGPLLI